MGHKMTPKCDLSGNLYCEWKYMTKKSYLFESTAIQLTCNLSTYYVSGS